MSKSKRPVPVVAEVPKAEVQMTGESPKTYLSETDKLAMNLANEQRKTALAEAKTALANSEKAELAFKYTILQIYMKYGLTDQDALNEQGEIIKGGAVK